MHALRIALAGMALVAAVLAQQPPTAPLPAPGASQAPDNACEEFQGALSVHIHPLGTHLRPAAELLLTDPKGRKTGLDPAQRKAYQEIPNSSYELEGIDDDETGEPGPSSGIVDVWCAPEEGEYTLEVIGILRGQYQLEVVGTDLELEPSHRLLGPLSIRPGARHKYVIGYERRPGAQVKVRRVAPPPRPPAP